MAKKEKLYALIKNGITVGTIVAEPDFIPTIQDQYDEVIRVDHLKPYPGPNWPFDPVTRKFKHPRSANNLEIDVNGIVEVDLPDNAGRGRPND